MALLDERGGPPTPRTGFRPRRVTEAPKRGGEIPLVDNPTAQFTYLPGSNNRAGLLNNPGAVSFDDIQNGYMADSYIHQGSSKYAEKIVKEGWHLQGQNPSAVEYLYTRLDMMTASTGIYYMFPFMQSFRDYVKFGNGFLVKARLQKNANIFGMKKKGMRRTGTPEGKNKPPVGGYFAASPTTLEPIFDQKSNKLKGWKQSSPGQGAVEFDLDDVVHFAYDRQSGEIYGTSYLLPVLDDVRALRQCEEMICHLVFKSLNPLIHHEVPDTTGTGTGDQADVDRAAREHKVMAVNGYLVSPPGHKINVIGVESKALRAEGYISILKHRVFAGLGLSDLIMGEGSTTSVGASDSFSGVMHDRIRFCQKELADYLTYYILWELLIEGGFDPIFNPKDRVYWKFNEVDIDRRIREEAHWTQLYQGNVLTEDEARMMMNRPVLAESDRQKLYLNTVQIPLAQAGSESQAVSSSGNSGNSSGPKQPSAQKPAKKEQATPDRTFFTQVKRSVSDLVVKACASGTPLSTETILLTVDSCARTVEAVHGNLSPNAINTARTAVQATFGTTTIEASSARQLINTLHGWLNSHMCF